MTRIYLKNGYYIEVDTMNYTLKREYIGKDKDGNVKNAVKACGYFPNIRQGVCKHLIPYTKKPSGLYDFRKSEQKAQRFRRNKVDCENQMSINDFMEVIEE